MSPSTASVSISSRSSHNGRHVSLMTTFFLCLSVLSLSLPAVQAASMRGDSSSGSASASQTAVSFGVYSVWDANDTCSEPERSNNCLVDVTCSTCVQRPGCAIESTTGKCVSESRINASHVGVEYFSSSNNDYCLPKDSACDACRAPDAASNAVCRGFNGCVCLHQCEAAPVRVLECASATTTFNWFYLVVALAILAPTLIMARVYKYLARNLSSDISRSIVRDQRATAHDNNPMTMKLDGWRGYMEKEHPDKLDHKLCPVRMSADEEAAALEAGRKTEDCDTLSEISENQRAQSISSLYDDESKEDHEYVCASTPKASATTTNSTRI